MSFLSQLPHTISFVERVLLTHHWGFGIYLVFGACIPGLDATWSQWVGQPAPKREGRSLAFLPNPLQVRVLCVMAQSCIFSIHWNLMFCFWFIMYASILLINYMCNCTIGTTASQRQHIIKLTLVVIELFRPWQDHWPLRGGCAAMCEPRTCLRGLPPGFPTPPRPRTSTGQACTRAGWASFRRCWADRSEGLGSRASNAPASLFLCLCPKGYWPQSRCLVKTGMNKS